MKTMTLKKFLLLVCCWGMSTHGFAIKKSIDLDGKCLSDVRRAMLALPAFGAVSAVKSIVGAKSDQEWKTAVTGFIVKQRVGKNLKALLDSENPLERDLGLILVWVAIEDPKDNKETKAMKKAIKDMYGLKFYS